MLAIDPPLAALHGARLDHSGAVAHGLINAAEHLVASTLRLNARVLDCLARRSREQNHVISPLLVVDVATDPSVDELSASLVQEQIHLGADLGTRWIALGEWHQHGINAVFSHWLTRCEQAFHGLPLSSGVAVLQKAVESADRSVSEAAVVAVGAAEALADEAERIEAAVQPRKRVRKN